MKKNILIAVVSLISVCGSLSFAGGLRSKLINSSDLNYKLSEEIVVVGTDVRKIILKHKYLPSATLLLKVPLEQTTQTNPTNVKSGNGALPTKWPTAFILAGVETNLDLFAKVPAISRTNMFMFDFSDIWSALQDKRTIIDALYEVTSLPLQIAAAYLWIQSQPYVNADEVVAINVSFGSFVAPASYRILNDLKIWPSKTVFAFGGGSLDPILNKLIDEADLGRSVRKDARRAVADIADFLRPESNLKYLKGPFLIVRGTNDQVIPVESSDVLFRQLSEPKTVVELEVGHINSNSLDIITATIDKIQDWLAQQK